MTDDDVDDIKAGVASLRKALRSIQNAGRAVASMRESHEKADAEIALTHALEMAAVAERLFSSVIRDDGEARQTTAVDEYADWTAEDLEPQVE